MSNSRGGDAGYDDSLLSVSSYDTRTGSIGLNKGEWITLVLFEVLKRELY